VRSEEGALRYLDAIYAALGAVLHEVRPVLLVMDAMRRTTSQGIGFRLGFGWGSGGVPDATGARACV